MRVWERGSGGEDHGLRHEARARPWWQSVLNGRAKDTDVDVLLLGGTLTYPLHG